MATEAVGDMPIRNFLGGRWTEKAERISGQTMFKKYGKHERSCLSCPSNCTLVVGIPGTLVGHAPEYETIGAFSSMCECAEIEVIAKCNELCNDYGLDTISAGNTIAFAMEAFEKGLLTEADLGGIRLTWGNGEAMIALLHKMGRRAESGLPFPDLGYTAPMDPYITDGKAQLAVKMHDLMVIYDGLGICKFYIVVAYGPTIMAEWLNYCTGWKVTPDGLMRTAERIFNVKRLINVGRGLGRKDDYLPKRLLTLPQRDDIGPVDPQGMQRMLTEYYQIRG